MQPLSLQWDWRKDLSLSEQKWSRSLTKWRSYLCKDRTGDVVFTPEQVGHMEAVLASAADPEQGIAWGKFCFSNSCLKHALCVGTKNYLSAEAVSYKNGIFH